MDKLKARGFFQITTVFDDAHDSAQSLLYSGSIRNALQRLLPSHFFFSDETHEQLFEEFLRLLPVIKWSEWGEGSCNLSIFLLCPHRANGVKFFYEMVSRWLMPGKRPNISSFFATDFKFAELSDEMFTISEMVISLEESWIIDSIRRQLPILENELRMGLRSVYHANRILEIKGLSADEKTSLIQGRIASLLKRRPYDFDHDIFIQMQYFLILCSEEFKAIREYAHMSRMIYIFYLFHKALSDQILKHPSQRSIQVKLSKTYLHLPFGLKKVLGVFLALNFLNHNEFFEERHLIGAIKTNFPDLGIIENSFFSHTFKEERIQVLYLEVQHENEHDFSLKEMRYIKASLPDAIRNGIEKVVRPLFMPRNEEEVMRNIITLSHQLKFFRDLPQVIIAFDEQTDAELFFNVIWLRVLKPEDHSLQELFSLRDSFITYVPDRIKKVGMLRNKYPKEATVFRLKFSAQPFLRPDQSVDLFKARQALVQEMLQILGEFRDYNGGMIAKQHEQFLTLKKLFPSLDVKEEVLLENFFNSIFPIEMRSVFNPHPIKKLFTMLKDVMEKSREQEQKATVSYQNDHQYCYFLLSGQAPVLKQRAMERVREMQIPSSQLLTVDLSVLETSYFAYIYAEEDHFLQEKFLNSLCHHLQSLTFEPQTSYH